MTSKTIIKIAESLSNTRINHVEPLLGGRNSRIYRVQNGDNPFALKFFRTDANNSRDRFEAETSALKLFAANGLGCTARIISQDRENNCILIEWIDGKPIVDFGLEDIDALSDFVKTVHEIAKQEKGKHIRFATEACLNGNEIVMQIERRLERLEIAFTSHHELQEFLQADFIPAFKEITCWSENEYQKNGMDFHQDILPEQLTLSPVDIGFHNCLWANKKMHFLDFEFFGWDDPVKLVADTLQHPGRMLGKTQNEHLATSLHSIFENDRQFVIRLRCLYPLFGLKWCMIMLNPFLPGYQSASSNDPNTKDTQLVKVRSLTEDVSKNYRDLAHG